MNQQPVISPYDVAVYGQPEGPVFTYRRTYESENFVNPVAPNTPLRTTDVWSVYRWDDEKGEWKWVADCCDQSTAESLSKLLAGTSDAYRAAA